MVLSSCAMRKKFPYLLRELAVARSDQVWCAEITCVPMPVGKACLCAVMDSHSRKVLGWEVSNTMDTGLCLRALQRALDGCGHAPGIFNTDQGSQFASVEWTGKLLELKVNISMDGKVRCMDNVFIERLWRSVKYEEIYIREHACLPKLEAGLAVWFERYNTWRAHEAQGNLTPHDVYTSLPLKEPARGSCAPSAAA